MSLAAQLTAFHDALMERLSPADAQAVRAAEHALAHSGIEQRALQPGAAAPDFALADQRGTVVRLAELRRLGPVVVVFFRGGWCPFCSLTLRAYQAVLPAVRQAGASLLAVTPQPAEGCSKAAECHMLGFPILSDPGNVVAEAFGIAYDLPEELRGLFKRMGHDLPKVNRTGDWRTPLPSVFVIDRDGTVAATHVMPAVHRRMEPADLVAAVQALAQQEAGVETA